MLTSYVMLDSTSFGVPSGNYDGSSMDFVGTAQTAANYYQGLGNMQTLTVRVSDFVGRINLTATLNNDWQTAVWFNTREFGDPLFPITGVFTFSIRGNFVWMRPEIFDFAQGTIESITITY